MKTRAGKMRHTITIQEATLSADADGQPIETWASVYEDIPMELVIARPDNERNVGTQQRTTPTQQFRIRYREGITTAMRCVWRGTNWNITGVVDQTGLQWDLLLEVTH